MFGGGTLKASSYHFEEELQKSQGRTPFPFLIRCGEGPVSSKGWKSVNHYAAWGVTLRSMTLPTFFQVRRNS